MQACEGSKGNWGLLHNTCQVLITWLTNERWCWTANSVFCLYVCFSAIFGGLELDCIQLLISFLFSYSIAIIFLGSRTNNASGWSFTSFTTFMYIIISISIFLGISDIVHRNFPGCVLWVFIFIFCIIDFVCLNGRLACLKWLVRLIFGLPLITFSSYICYEKLIHHAQACHCFNTGLNQIANTLTA